MRWDEARYLDYLAEHESGFMGMNPPELIGTEEALRRIVEQIAWEAPMTNRRRRRAKVIRKAGGVRKARGKR